MIKPISVIGSFILVLSFAPISVADSAPKVIQKSGIVYFYEDPAWSGYCVAKEEQYFSGVGFGTAREDVVRELGNPKKIVENWATNTDDYYYDGALILVGKGTNSVILMEVTKPEFSTPSGFRVGLTLEEVKEILDYPKFF